MSTPQIVSAWYGIEKDVNGIDVTEVVKNYVAEGQTSIHVSNGSMGGDPNWGSNKILWVTYSVDGGVTTKVVETTELEYLDVSALV
jgi:hypothetical protein